MKIKYGLQETARILRDTMKFIQSPLKRSPSRRTLRVLLRMSGVEGSFLGASGLWLNIKFYFDCFSARPEEAVKPSRRIRAAFLLLILLLTTTTAQASLQQTAPNNIAFATSARAQLGEKPALYIGAAPSVLPLIKQATDTKVDPKVLATMKTFKLARIMQAQADSLDGQVNVLLPFAPSSVKVDGADATHPLHDPTTVIGQMTTLAGKWPLFTTAKYAAGTLPTFGGLFLVTDEAAGAVISKFESLTDYADGTVDAPPAALTAGNTFAFAAVSKAGTQFDDLSETARGIAILKYEANAVPSSGGEDEENGGGANSPFKQINAEDAVSSDVAKALKIDLSAPQGGSPILAFGDGTPNSISHALVGRAASMAWDEKLERLYVGFNAVRADDALKAGGVLGVCMAYPVKDATGKLQKFLTGPVVDSPSKGLFYSALGAAITELSNPDGSVNLLPDVANPAPAPGFSVTVSDLQICLKVLQKAVEYVRAPVGGVNTATGLLDYLRGQGANAADIFTTLAAAQVFLSDFAAGGIAAYALNIFGATAAVANSAGGQAAPGGANTDATLLTAIRARFVQLLSNAKIVNKAYAMANEPNSVYTNSLDMIIGVFTDGATTRLDDATGIPQARNDGNDDLSVSIPRLTVMNTSTGRPYLIVHSIMSTSPIALGGTMFNEADNWIYALPLIPTALNGAEFFKGTIAQVTNDKIGTIDLAAPGVVGDEYQPPQGVAGMPKRFHRAVRVGGGNPVPASWVQDLFVSGDSVYVTLAGILPGQQGVFKSSAIFDDKGRIIDWTPATRVMGSVLQTFASMVDPTSANFYSLTQATPGTTQSNSLGGATTGQLTQWGRRSLDTIAGAITRDERARALDVVLGGLFDQKKGGVHGVLAFDELTYGFPPKQLSAVMAYGFDGVAFAKTGERLGRAFVPVTQYKLAQPLPAADQNVWNFNVDIGPITCGGVVHNPPVGANPGWTRFYVGGYQGLAMLEVAYADGAGFLGALPAALRAGFGPHGVPGMQAGDQVSAVGEAVTRHPAGHANAGEINQRYLHVLTQRGVVVNEIGVAGVGAWVGASILQPPTDALDGAVLADGTIVAHAAGLSFVPAAVGAAPVGLQFGGGVTPLQIQVVASRDKDGLWALPATVYVLGVGPMLPDDVPADNAAATVSSTTLVTQLWRVAVYYAPPAGGGAVQLQSSVIDKYGIHATKKGQPRPYAQYPSLRLNFGVDGSVLFDVSSSDGSDSDFLRVSQLVAPTSGLADVVALQASITDVLDVDRSGNFKIGVPSRNSATGSWLVPGDWGLRVNE